jgi:hypothetical protein
MKVSRGSNCTVASSGAVLTDHKRNCNTDASVARYTPLWLVDRLSVMKSHVDAHDPLFKAEISLVLGREMSEI